MKKYTGQSLVELLLAIGLAAIILPVIAIGIFATKGGTAQQKERYTAMGLLHEGMEAVRSVRENGWSFVPVDGTYHPAISGNAWTLVAGNETVGLFTREIVIEQVYRQNGVIAPTGILDPSTRKVTVHVSWTQPRLSTVSLTTYLSRYLDNLSYIQTTQADFLADTRIQTKIMTTAGGEVTLADNNKAQWCGPTFSSATIDLPDGPPVAVDARSAQSTLQPNDVFVGTAPYATSSVKLSHIQVPANQDPPAPFVKGIFSLDPARYSDTGLVPSGLGFDNNFKTNDVRYYKSPAGKIYALIATTLPSHEVIAVQVNDGTGNSSFQDPTNKIYRYWTRFNTRIYNTAAGLDTGFKDPSATLAESTGDANGFASYPTRAYTSNNSYAIDSNSGSGASTNCLATDKDRQQYYNYNFPIPGGANINAIEIKLDAYADRVTGSPFMCVQLSWDGGVNWTDPKMTATLTTSKQSYILGGSADLWGHLWNTNEISNTNFRMRVTPVSSDTTRDFYLDWASVKIYFSGGANSSNDQAPFDYGGTALTVLGDRGYVSSGGYLYVFDLSTIDSKSSTDELDQLGCRIQLDGYDCQPGTTGTDKKYSLGETGTSWSDTAAPAHNNCADGGNIELYATNDLYGVTVDGKNYIYVAVGAGTNPEFVIVNATDIPTASTSPAINYTNCGAISGGNANWKRISTYDFNTNSGTEEAANSVFAKSDGTRAYISSNGTSDSKQFYILNTTNKNSPSFLSGSPSTGPSSGYYQGSGANGELYPRRSMTVLNGLRAVLVGKDGVANTNDAQEYQVLTMTNESTPGYCAGINFNEGFNDLTYVTEADFDNYVYMIANNTSNELKIIQGGPDGAYLDQGTLESTTYDTGYSTAFNSFSPNVSLPAGTNIRFQFASADQVSGSCNNATYIFTGPDGLTTSYYNATQSAIFVDNDGLGYENPAQCFRYKAYFTTTDFNTTPTLYDITVNHSP